MQQVAWELIQLQRRYTQLLDKQMLPKSGHPRVSNNQHLVLANVWKCGLDHPQRTIHGPKNVDLNFQLHYFRNFWRLKHSATCQTLHANLPRSMLAGFDALLVERLTKEASVSAALTAFLPHGLERCRQAWYVEARSFAHNVAKPEATNSWSAERWWTNRIYTVSIDI